jgi:predicted RNA-binding Zn ribbon-like protein
LADYVNRLAESESIMTTASPAPRLDEPAPLALVNTIWVDRTGVHDVLADRADVRTWMSAIGEQCGLTPGIDGAQELSTEAVRHLVDLRDALRRLASEHTQDPRSLGRSPVHDVATATSILNSASAMSTVWPELRPDGTTLLRRAGIADDSFADVLTTVVAQQAIYLVASRQWALLRPCTAPGCAYYFVKNHRREWCSALCGNRARVARHTQRHRGAGGPEGISAGPAALRLSAVPNPKNGDPDEI